MNEIVDYFNQATYFTMGCRDRIKNLVANRSFANVTMDPSTGSFTLTYSTTRKGKPAQTGISYVIDRERLTEQQIIDLLAASNKGK